MENMWDWLLEKNKLGRERTLAIFMGVSLSLWVSTDFWHTLGVTT